MVKAGVIHKPEYGYVISDFVNMDVCTLEKDKPNEATEEAKP